MKDLITLSGSDSKYEFLVFLVKTLIFCNDICYLCQCFHLLLSNNVDYLAHETEKSVYYCYLFSLGMICHDDDSINLFWGHVDILGA